MTERVCGNAHRKENEKMLAHIICDVNTLERKAGLNNTVPDGSVGKRLLRDARNKLRDARNEIDEKLSIDIQNDFDTYFFSNFIDCPLQYSEECKEAIENALKKKEIAVDELNECTQYVLSEMGIDN